jgi:hypothetical protein
MTSESNNVFTWMNKQGVRSDKGFEVQSTGRFDLEYREGANIVSIYVESGLIGGLPSLSIEPDAFLRWDSGIAIPKDEQTRLFENLRAALAFQGLKLVVEKGT